jgi:hypothetical protein
MIPRTRDALAQLLAQTFPHSHDIDAATVDAFVDRLMQVKTQSRASDPGAEEGGAKRRAAKGQVDRSPVATADELGQHPLFMMRATHARRTPITSVFTGVTQAVRVRLPLDEPEVIATSIGEVRPDDHFLPTVAAVRERFGERLDRACARVDLPTSARSAGIRFSPMALYFGYEREHSETPCFVIYEPGDAVGKPGALYFAATLDTLIEEPAGYKPTPLASPEDWYSGGLRMASNGRDPEVLFMHAAKQRGGEPHFRLHVEYVPHATPEGSPIGALVEAALRMLAVQKGAGSDQSLIERLVAETGLLLLPWVDRPDNGSQPDQLTLAEQTFEPSRVFEPFLAELADDERASFEASVVLLLGAVVRADRELDRQEQIELDWLMNFAVPGTLGNAFRFSEAATREYEAVLAGTAVIAGPAFERRLVELGAIVRRLPHDLRQRYTSFVVEVCKDAAEASGGWLWFGSKVGEQEKQVLDRIAAALGLAD